MSTTVRLRNISPLGRIDLPLLRREGDVDGEGIGCLEPGEVFDCPVELAGRAPSGRPSVGEPGDDGYDPGHDWDPGDGLLAQTGNFELVRARAKKVPAKKTPAKKAPAKKAAPSQPAPQAPTNEDA